MVVTGAPAFGSESPWVDEGGVLDCASAMQPRNATIAQGIILEAIPKFGTCVFSKCIFVFSGRDSTWSKNTLQCEKPPIEDWL
jgi:hypothetical protein